MNLSDPEVINELGAKENQISATESAHYFFGFSDIFFLFLVNLFSGLLCQ